MPRLLPVTESDNLIFMSEKRIVTATEFARNLSSLLSEVRYREITLEVRRGKESVAVVQPPRPSAAGFPIERMNAFFDGLPALDAVEADAFRRDIRSIDETVGRLDDPWGS